MGQKLKHYLKIYSSIITSNISLFLAVGCLNILISGCRVTAVRETGLFSVMENMAALFYHQVIPLALSGTAGMRAAGSSQEKTGRAAAVIAAAGLLAAGGTGGIFWSVPVGALAGFLAGSGERKLQNRIPSGFEMIGKNILTAGAGLFTAAVAVFVISPVAAWLERLLFPVLDQAIGSRALFLSSIFVEPMKLFFLNNGLNHGILVPLGMRQLEQTGKSVLFLLETNPGPGLGVLLGYWIVRKPKRRDYGAEMVIEFLGGIHEVYFPYVTSHVSLFPAVLAGGAAGTGVFQLFGVGLAGPVSPGSILGILFLSRLSDWPGICLGVGCSALVSCLISVAALRKIEQKARRQAEETKPVREAYTSTEVDVEKTMGTSTETIMDTGTEIIMDTGTEKNMDTNAEKNIETTMEPLISCIYVVCDAGLGSSAMGAALLRRKLKAAGINGIRVQAAALEDLPPDGDLLICQTDFFQQRLADRRGLPETVLLERLTDSEAYEHLIESHRSRFFCAADETNNQVQ